MRRLVGMLRSDSDDPLAPQPGLDDLPTLVDQVREAGLPVELQVEGERRELPVGIELSAYRIVQEALTNALKHAGDAHALVHVRYGADSLELEIVDDGAGRRPRRERRPRACRDARAGRALRRPPRRRPVAAAASPSACCCRSDDDASSSPTTRRSSASACARSSRRAGDEVVGEAGDGEDAVAAGAAASTGRRADGHPHAGARRHRGDPPDRRARSRRHAC